MRLAEFLARRLPLLLLPAALSCTSSAPLTIRVFAAASLTNAFTEISRDFENHHPGIRVELNFAGSQILRTQIEQGAPADVFASADEFQMEPLRRAGLVHPPRPFIRNRLVVIASGEGGKVNDLQDLVTPGVRVSMAEEAVPVGRYCRELLDTLGRLGCGGDFRPKVEANVISLETNVRAVLTRVMLGEADAGFVYGTDAAGAGERVRTLALPEGADVTASYYITVLAGTALKPEAEMFLDFVSGTPGRVYR